MKATFELTKADLEEAVTDYINKVLQPNVRYDLGDLSVTFKADDLDISAIAQVIDTPGGDDDDEGGHSGHESLRGGKSRMITRPPAGRQPARYTASASPHSLR